MAFGSSFAYDFSEGEMLRQKDPRNAVFSGPDEFLTLRGKDVETDVSGSRHHFFLGNST